MEYTCPTFSSELSFIPSKKAWVCTILGHGEEYEYIRTKRKVDAQLLGEIHVASLYRQMLEMYISTAKFQAHTMTLLPPRP